MRRIIDNDYITLLFRLIVGIVFIYAAYSKIMVPATFAKSIWFYHMVPGSFINFMAIYLPWIELVCGVFLIIGFQYRGAVILVNILMIIFIIALSSAVYRGISIDCGCFKTSKATGSSATEALIRDIGLIILTMQLCWSRSKKYIMDEQQS